jgi:hypothetical protein
MATISGAGLAIPDGTVVSAVSAAPGVATVTASVNAAGGFAAFTLTGVTVGTSHVTFSATGYADVVVAVSVSAPAPSPGPAPSSPPSAPLSVSGVAGDGSVLLTWVAPVSPGTFPVSTYQAVVSPGGQSCLVSAPKLTCAISGLSNGTTYIAMVRALNGGGWGPYSEASGAFTPELPIAPTITITGTRGDVRGKPGIRVTGGSTGLEAGAVLRPWTRFPGESAYTQGAANILIDSGGAFTWERRTGKTIHVLMRSADGTLESNRITIRSR